MSSTNKNRAGGFSKVGATLSGLLSRYNLDSEIARYDFVLHWPEIVGEEVAKRTRPECIRGGTLVIAVQNSVWAQELTFNKRVILSRLQNRLPNEEVVSDIAFYVSPELASKF